MQNHKHFLGDDKPNNGTWAPVHKLDGEEYTFGYGIPRSRLKEVDFRWELVHTRSTEEPDKIPAFLSRGWHYRRGGRYLENLTLKKHGGHIHLGRKSGSFLLLNRGGGGYV